MGSQGKCTKADVSIVAYVEIDSKREGFKRCHFAGAGVVQGGTLPRRPGCRTSASKKNDQSKENKKKAFHIAIDEQFICDSICRNN